MFHFPALPPPALCVQAGVTGNYARSGFPIRKSPDQCLVADFPGLIAGSNVLLRLLVPRHPPCALSILTVSSAAPVGAVGANYPFGLCAVFKLRRGRQPYDVRPRSLKTEQRRPVDVSGLLPRKEVIQPQLPLRLPCYDFTPITSPTFDGCLP